MTENTLIDSGVPLTLGDIAAEVAAQAIGNEEKIALIDITAFTKRGADNPLVLSWQHPSIPGMYRIRPDAEILLRRNKGWNLALALDVATLAAVHVAPVEGLAPGSLYESIANTNKALHLFLMGRLSQTFPDLKTADDDSETLIELCATYLLRHPDELQDVPVHILAVLQKRVEAKQAASNVTL